VLAGPAWVSAVGSTVSYNTLDSNRADSGVLSALNQDLAGLAATCGPQDHRGFRAYTPIAGDVVGIGRAQAGYVTPWAARRLPLADGFFGGPQLVRGFAPNGFGPRDLTPGTTDNVGGRNTGRPAPSCSPGPAAARRERAQARAVRGCGSVWGYRGPHWRNPCSIRAGGGFQSAARIAGRRPHLDSPFGPIRRTMRYR